MDYSPGVEICGVDEAGRGPLAGPLSLSVVHYSRDVLIEIFNRNILKELNDSKKLSSKVREKLLPEIQKYASCIVHQFVSNRFIDRFGISYSIFYGIRKMVSKSKLKSPFLLIDGNYNFSRFGPDWGYRSIVKGDSKIASIASASIVSKVKRDALMISMARKFPEYDFASHKGYGTKKHIAAIETFGSSKLHRISFLNNFRVPGHGLQS